MSTQRRFEQLAFASLNEADCPDTDLLAAYILRELTGNEQLSVDAHVRTCPLCQHDIALCNPPRPRSVIARLISPLVTTPNPELAYRSRRSDRGRRSYDSENVRRYEAADLIVELTIVPPVGDYWRITGQVLRQNEGLPAQTIILRSGRRQYQQTTDELGFFTFEGLPEGRYTLTVEHGPVQVQIRALLLPPNPV